MNARAQDLKRLQEVRNLYATGDAKRLRLQAGVSQAEFARGLGANRATVCLWETGDRRPSTALALKAWALFQLLKVTQ